jgi:hypothetical protein
MVGGLQRMVELGHGLAVGVAAEAIKEDENSIDESFGRASAGHGKSK